MDHVFRVRRCDEKPHPWIAKRPLHYVNATRVGAVDIDVVPVLYVALM
jgi:hypothetical protein